MAEESAVRKPDLAVWIQFPRRLLLLLLAFAFSTLLIFAIARIGNAFIMAGAAGRIPPAEMERLEAMMGGDRPLIAAYFDWLGGLLSGEWGISLVGGRGVRELIGDRLGNSLSLLLAGIVLGLLTAAVFGAVGALIHRLEERRGLPGSILKGLGRLWVFPRTARPLFLSGLAGIILLIALSGGSSGPILPFAGAVSVSGEGAGSLGDRLAHTILPGTTLSLYVAGVVGQALARRLTLSSAASTLRRWLSAGLKGLSLVAAQAGGMLGGLIMIEMVFGYPGIGRLFFDALVRRDYPVTIGLLVVMTVMVLAGRGIAELFGWLARMTEGGGVAASAVEVTDWRRKARRIAVFVGLAALIVPLACGLAGLAAPLVADPTNYDPGDRLLPPGAEGHLLGTDEVGRDLLVRVLAGGLPAIGVGGLAALGALVLAAPGIALVGWLRQSPTLVRESLADVALFPADVLTCLPLLPAILAFLGAVSGPGAGAILLAVVIGLPLSSRIVRAGAALWQSAPAGTGRAVTILRGAGALFLGGWFAALTLIATVDFIGFGAQPPATAWGSMIGSARNMLTTPNSLIWPGLALWIVLTALYTAADSLIGYFNTKEVMVRLNE